MINLFFQKLPYPKSIWFIVGNEFCERFSYYGMKGKNNNDRKPFKDRDYRKRDLKSISPRDEQTNDLSKSFVSCIFWSRMP